MYAYHLAKASEVMIVNSTNPIIASVIACALLKEKVATLEAILLISAFTGVIILSTAKNEQIEEIFPYRFLGLFFSFISGIAAAIAYTLI